jgi:hypothetical protein
MADPDAGGSADAAAKLDAFRAETRAWLEANAPPGARKPPVGTEETVWGGRTRSLRAKTCRVTDELDIGLFLKRSRVTGETFGDDYFQKERLARIAWRI